MVERGDAVNLLTAEEVSELTRVPAATLRYWRSCRHGQGPPSFRVGRRVLYRREAVEQWVSDQEAADREARAVSSGH